MTFVSMGVLRMIEFNPYDKAFTDDPPRATRSVLSNARGVSTLPARLGAFGDAGFIVTGGGLVFAGGGDTAFHAIDKRTGAELWSYATGDAATTGTPMTYRVGGRQYVVIAVGGPGPGAALLAFSL